MEQLYKALLFHSFAPRAGLDLSQSSNLFSPSAVVTFALNPKSFLAALMLKQCVCDTASAINRVI